MDRPSVENIGYLLAKASQWWNEQFTATLAGSGFASMRASYGSVLLPLWEQDGMRMGALAERSRLSKQTMTTLVRLAERDGFVVRRSDPSDRRATRVWLTPDAVALAPVAARVVDDLHSRIEAALGPQAVRTLRDSLSTIMTMQHEEGTNHGHHRAHAR